METFLQDVRFAIRNLKKTRGFTAVAVVTLALGIGANTAIFSVINAVLIQPLPFHQPGQLVRLYETESAPGNYPFSPPDFIDWKKQNTTFQDMTLFSWPHNLNLSGQGSPEQVLAYPTEANFFSLLGVRPLLGRTWAPGEDEPGKDQVAILSYAFWQSHFGGDPKVLGRTVELDAKKYTIVGVMPASFHYPSRAQLWTPMDMDTKSLGQRGSHWAHAIGRLKPGVTVQQAQAELSLIAKRLEEQYPDSNHKVGAVVLPLHEDLVGGSRSSLLLMLWAVAFVLLIACANVANLLLSRAVARQKEMAIRSALGAARARLVRQLLTESVLLALVGGVLGVILAWGGVRLLANARNFGIPRTNPIEVNLTVLAFTFLLAVITGVLFGVVPALHTSRPDVHDELKGGAGSSVSPGRHRRLASDILVIGEVALSLLLLVCAGLLLKDFVRLRNSNVGVRPEGVWTGLLILPKATYKDIDRQLNFSQQILEKIKHIPGVESAALSDRVPLEGGSNSYVKLRGQNTERMSGPLVENHSVSPDYFHVMGIPLIAGRDLTDEDVARTKQFDLQLNKYWEDNVEPPHELTDSVIKPCVINEAMAKHFWPNQSPLGQLFSPGGDHGPWREVVGVVGDVKQWGLTNPPQPEHYDAFDGGSGFFLVLHASVAPQSITGAVRAALGQQDSSLALFNVRTMDEVIAENATGQQFLSLLLGSFAGLALLLAAVGIYGVLSYVVTQRTREIGIRMSLGATRGRVLGLVLRQGLRLALVGFAIGIVGALAAGRLLGSLLHEVKPSDPAIFVVTAACLAAVALIACYVPARRASRVDPMVALRYE